MAKNNIRSLRFSDEMMKIILDFEGANFNEKFENLVYHCYKAVPAKRKQFKKLTEDCEQLRKEMSDMYSERRELLMEISTYRDAKNTLTKIQLTACDILEELQKCNT